MSWSLGEIEALTIKAVRGASISWGLAQEAGFTVRWLEQRSLPGLTSLALLLEEYVQQSQPLSHNSPIITGSVILDHKTWVQQFPVELYQPILLIPFLAKCAGSDVLELSWHNNSICFNSDAASAISEDCLMTGLHTCMLRKVDTFSPVCKRVTRVERNRAPDVKTLEKFAHKTYAPATEESRQKGAGTGLSDND